MSKIIQFGENVEGYAIPVLNEREIRASAGILFLLMFISIYTVIFANDFLLLKYIVMIFMSDMAIRVLVNPKYSPFLILGRFIVRNQVPEYVGAPQKKFAWKIGLVLSIIIFILQNIVNSFGPITALICLICLVFLFFETAFGICLACKLYARFYKNKVQYCPGEVCEIKDRQDIQRTSRLQWMVAIGFIGYIVLITFLFYNTFNQHPEPLWDIITGAIDK